MFNFIENLEPLHQSFWWVAIAASLVFAVQTILTFIGGDSSTGIDADFDGNLDHADAPFQLFSFRNLVNFLLGFGWTGVAFFESIGNKTVLVVLATIVGLVFVLAFFFLIQQILKLTEDNTFNIQNLVGKTGEVYLRIPAQKSGKGKVLISLNGSNHEMLAMTLSDTEISSGEMVKVNTIEDQLLIVSKI